MAATGNTSAQMSLRDPDVRLMLRVRGDEPGAFEELVGAYQHRLISHFDMKRIAVGLGIHRDRRNSHAAGRLDHPAGDLAAICDQNFLEHLLGFDPWAGSSPAIWHAGADVTIASTANWGAGNRLSPQASGGAAATQPE